MKVLLLMTFLFGTALAYPQDDDGPVWGGSNNDDDDDDGGISSRVGNPQSSFGNCECVPYYLCKDNNIITDGSGVLDPRKKPVPSKEPGLSARLGPEGPSGCGPFHVCCTAPTTSTVKPYTHQCGFRNVNGINKRILSPNGKDLSEFGEWPWQGAVLKVEGKVNIFQCGAVLIDSFHLLTVAHCVYRFTLANAFPLKVRLGEWDTQNTDEFLKHEDYEVEKIYIHSKYNHERKNLWDDIAILKLKVEVSFGPHIDTICLPNYQENFEGVQCVVTGWGKNAYKNGTYSNVLREVHVPVISNDKCEQLLKETRLSKWFVLYENFTCAGGESNADSCKGDGGGPLACWRKDGTYALAGLVSWGIDCGSPNVPGVYVRVAKYLDWIAQITGRPVTDYWPRS
ncbi:chymotrypsinogen A-like [Limulus polyphemus]|uniref:Chymotrypsinogen A-like n=1 Tax=Limulus polyphemus TaxID=6850 RepID=A0ABM1C504_LIMPO|nr:chymotrypsinogen A-like [Limulus polyphemus]